MAVVVVTAAGRRISAAPTNFFMPGRVVPTDLTPGASVSSALLTYTFCDGYAGDSAGAVKSAYVDLLLGGDSISLGQPNGRPVNVRCRPGFQRLGRPIPPPSPNVVGTLFALQARLILNQPARSGGVVWPLLQLTNPTGEAVPLAPCPSYIIGLGVFGGAGFHASYRLNCQVITSIPAGKTVTYQLRLNVPNAAGAAKLYWQMLPRTMDPPLPAAAVSIHVT